MRKYAILIWLSFLLLSPYTVRAFSSGFPDSPFWISPDKFSEDDTVLLQSVVANTTTNPLTATVEFFDKKTLLGKAVVTIPARDAIIASVSWKATAGDHAFRAVISNPSFGGHSGTFPDSSESDTISHFVAKKPVQNKVEQTPTTVSNTNKSDVSLSDGISVDDVTATAKSIGTTVGPQVTAAVGFMDKERAQLLAVVTKSNEKTQSYIDTQKTQKDSGTVSTTAKLKTPLAYIWLYLSHLIIFIAETPAIFYAIFVGVVVFLVRRLFVSFVG